MAVATLSDFLIQINAAARATAYVQRHFGWSPATEAGRELIEKRPEPRRFQNAAWRPSALQVHLSKASMPAKLDKFRTRPIMVSDR